jgi:hypothetical protein
MQDKTNIQRLANKAIDEIKNMPSEKFIQEWWRYQDQLNITEK